MRLSSQKSVLSFAALCLLSFSLSAQTKEQYKSLPDALMAGRSLYGKPGPESVNWTNGGKKYSYTENDEIHSMDPLTLKEELIFTSKGLNFPVSGKPFSYESFQWAKDFKHLVFKTNFRPIYRNSGISDYFIYDLD